MARHYYKGPYSRSAYGNHSSNRNRSRQSHNRRLNRKPTYNRSDHNYMYRRNKHNKPAHSRFKHGARVYNKKRYIGVKKLTGFIRQFLSLDIFERIKSNGFLGQFAGACGDKLIEKPLFQASYKLAGIFYDKNSDDPIKGSILFELWHMVLSILTKLCVEIRLK